MNLLKLLLTATIACTTICIQMESKELAKKENNKKEEVPCDSVNLVSVVKGDNKFDLNYYNRTEAFYSRSLGLLSPSPLDQAFYAQTTNDLNFSANICNSSIMSKASLRNKSRWGNSSVTRTTDAAIKLADAVVGSHYHAVPKQIFWLREGWVEVSFNKVFNVQAEGNHYVRYGTFSFELGRGISLGSAYAISPGLLGFYSSSIIDQYANGILFGGDICKDKLAYYVYASILENPCDRAEGNLFPLFAQEIGRRENPWRGFGQINILFASKLTWTIKNPICSSGNLTVEPYGMIDHAPEQKIEFDGDAASKLGTIGLCCEYKGPVIEWGFDVAANLGHQTVRPWDANKIDIKAINGVLTEVYSEVYSDSTKTTKAVVTSENKAVVDSSDQSPSQNGQQIYGSTLYNSDSRFTPGYKNHYRGFMMVGDFGGWVYKKELKLAATAAYVTGDENPNRDIFDPLSSSIDGNFDGFIGLQEVYSGKQVKSAMVLSSSAIPRPLSSPTTANSPRQGRFANNTSGFTNLVFFGLGAEWSPQDWCAKFKFRPNVLAYWQQNATKKFDIKTGLSTDQDASKFLGVEINGFLTVTLNKRLNGFIVMGLFVPGAHFKDVKGKPLSPDQTAYLDKYDVTGFTGEVLPTLGTKRAIMLNWGLEYTF